MFVNRIILIYFISTVGFQSILASWDKEWKEYKAKYRIKFQTAIEDLKSFKAYKANKKFIENFNKDLNMTFKLKPNGKIHFSMNEFKSRFLLRTNVTNKIRTKLSQLSMSLKKHPKTESELIVNMPIEIDWVKKGMVTPVRDQKSCGCCYAFSTCASIESALAIKTRQLVVLSPQQILDCSKIDFKNQGCDGGYADEAFSYVIANGIELDADYPYQLKENPSCNAKDSVKKYKIADFSEIFMDLDGMIQALVNNGPIVTYISASSHLFQYYGSGIINFKNCPNSFDSLDHAVTIVGYGTDKTTKEDYWLVKNSWGKDWGESGFFRIIRGKNMCGIEINSFSTLV